MIDYKTKYFKTFDQLYDTVRSFDIRANGKPVSIAWMIGVDAAISSGKNFHIANVLLSENPFPVDSLAARDYVAGFFSAKTLRKIVWESGLPRIVNRLKPSDYPHV
jgi:hypothetical protein